jgi:hypothetical protein
MVHLPCRRLERAKGAVLAHDREVGRQRDETAQIRLALPYRNGAPSAPLERVSPEPQADRTGHRVPALAEP